MTEQEPREHNTAEEPRVVVRDRRRIDPDTGHVRTVTEEVPADEESGRHAAAEPSAEPINTGPIEVQAEIVEPEIVPEIVEENPVQALRGQLDERTADLQRLQAEYANYRKRVDRDRESVISGAKAQVAGELLAVLDDVERAAAHGDLTGAFKAVADKLITTLQRVGLEPFGHENEPFDPAVHEAVQHSTSPDVQEPTVTAVLRRGYRIGERVLRPALVGVTDHEPGAAPVEAKPVEAEWFEPTAEGQPGGESADRN